MLHDTLLCLLKFDGGLDSFYATNVRIELKNIKGELQGTSSIEISPGAEKFIKAVLSLGHSDHLDEVITACVKAAQGLNKLE